MTRAEFLQALRELPSDFVMEDELTLRLSFGPDRFCPLTAVARARGSAYIEEEYYDSAGDFLGLPEELADRISEAADGCCGVPGTIGLREEMLEALQCRSS